MAEDLNYARIYFWLYIKYMYNCHESGELQRFDETNYIINNIEFIYMLEKYFILTLSDYSTRLY